MTWFDEILREARMRDMGEVIITPNDTPAGSVNHALVRLAQPRCNADDFSRCVRELFTPQEWALFESSRYVHIEKWCDSVGPVLFELTQERGSPVLRVKLLGLGIAG